MKPLRSILLAGLGNTGSHLAPLIARAGLADHLVIVDPDVVEAGNIGAQAYGPLSVGRTKVAAVTERLRGVNPSMEVEGIVGELEDLPLGYFSGTVVLCLDQDGARQIAAERAWWMGGTLFDVAVNGPLGLARVTRIARGGGGCLECGWADNQYAQLRARHSCRKTLPTKAPAALGSFAASLAAMQVLSPVPDDANVEIVSSPGAGEMYRTKLTANPDCRFLHEAPSVETLMLEAAAPISRLFERLETQTIGLPGFTFARRRRCVACGDEDETLLVKRGASTREACALCGGAIEFTPFHERSAIDISTLNAEQLMTSPEAIGLRDNDVIRTSPNRWIQLGRSHHSTPLATSHA